MLQRGGLSLDAKQGVEEQPSREQGVPDAAEQLSSEISNNDSKEGDADPEPPHDAEDDDKDDAPVGGSCLWAFFPGNSWHCAKRLTVTKLQVRLPMQKGI